VYKNDSILKHGKKIDLGDMVKDVVSGFGGVKVKKNRLSRAGGCASDN